MKTKKSNKKTPIHHIIVAVITGLLCIWQVSTLFIEDEAVEVDDSQEVAQLSKQDVVNGDNSSLTELPIRMRSAPDYDDILMAAKITKQAINQKEAQFFVQMKMSERSLVLKSKIIKTQREMAEDLYTIKEFQAKTNELSKTSELGDSNNSFVNSNEYPNGSMMSTQDIAPDNMGSLANNIRIVGWSSDGVTMTSEGIGANNIRQKQVLWGRYSVKSIDTDLKCVSLFDEKRNSKIPLVCFN